MFKNADTRFERITRLRSCSCQGGNTRSTIISACSTTRSRCARRLTSALFEIGCRATLQVERARALLAGWDAVYGRESAEAALYETWRVVAAEPPGGRRYRRIPATDQKDTGDLTSSLRAAIARLTASQGDDWRNWRWGRMHARAFPHPLVRAFDLPDVERAGRRWNRCRRRRDATGRFSTFRTGTARRHEHARAVGSAGQPVLQQPAAALGGEPILSTPLQPAGGRVERQTSTHPPRPAASDVEVRRSAMLLFSKEPV